MLTAVIDTNVFLNGLLDGSCEPRIEITACRDKNDNMFLECALAGDVDVIVTKDDDLPVLNPFRGISILRPEEFLKRIKP